MSNRLDRNRIINFDNLQNTITNKLCCNQCDSYLLINQQSIFKDQVSQVLNDPPLSEHKATIIFRLETKLSAITKQTPILILKVSEKSSVIATTLHIECQHDKAPVLKTPRLRRKA